MSHHPEVGLMWGILKNGMLCFFKIPWQVLSLCNCVCTYTKSLGEGFYNIWRNLRFCSGFGLVHSHSKLSVFGYWEIDNAKTTPNRNPISLSVPNSSWCVYFIFSMLPYNVSQVVPNSTTLYSLQFVQSFTLGTYLSRPEGEKY